MSWWSSRQFLLEGDKGAKGHPAPIGTSPAGAEHWRQSWGLVTGFIDSPCHGKWWTMSGIPHSWDGDGDRGRLEKRSSEVWSPSGDCARDKLPATYLQGSPWRSQQSQQSQHLNNPERSLKTSTPVRIQVRTVSWACTGVYLVWKIIVVMLSCAVLLALPLPRRRCTTFGND